MVPLNPDKIGALVVHYSYDGLGRVIRVQRPAGAAGTPGGGGKLCITDLYYDGVRVVQEVGWGGNAAAGGGAGVPFRVNHNADGYPDGGLPGLPRRANEMTGAHLLTQPCVPGSENPGGWSWEDRRLEREYIWAADSAAYVDENVAQLVYTAAHEPAAGSSIGQAAYQGDDTSATILYTLADHNANVIGLTDALGRLVAQYSYTPYGEVRAAEYFTPSDVGSLTSAETMAAAKGNRLGHQGLRMERFDRPWDGAMDRATSELPTATSAYRAVCHNRNRMYDPAEGRFLEQDPNGLGLGVSSVSASCGRQAWRSESRADLNQHTQDGLNTHTSYGCRPRQRQDASGLFYAVDVGMTVGSLANDLVSQYSLNLHDDLAWATDWSLPDSLHSRGSSRWVTRLLLQHAMDGLTDLYLGPAAMLRDMVALGEMVGEWLIGDDGSEAGDEEGDGNDGPVLAGTARSRGRPANLLPGHNAFARAGQIAHSKFYQRMKDLDPTWITNQRIPGSRLRPDAVHLASRTIIELKPDNPRAIARGWAQLKKYADELGGSWNLVVQTY